MFRNLKAKQFEDTGYKENMKNQFKSFALPVLLPIGERALVFGDGFRSLLKKSLNQTFDVLGHTAHAWKSLSSFGLPAFFGLLKPFLKNI